MAVQSRFQVSYEGRPVDNGTMAVGQLAEVFKGLDELFAETSYIITQGGGTTMLLVDANLRKGSLAFDIIANFEWRQTTLSFLNPDEINDLVHVLEILGLTGKRNALYGLYNKLQGKYPAKIEEHGDEVFYFDESGKKIRISKILDVLYRNPRARRAVGRIISPLNQEGMDRLRFQYNGKNTVKITKDDVDGYGDWKVEEQTFETERTLSLVSPSFIEGNKWRLMDSEGKIMFVTLLDDAFIQQVKDGRLSFTSKDELRVILRTIFHTEGEEIRERFEVVRVLNHISYIQEEFAFTTGDVAG